MKKAIFLDRDGTLIEDVKYLSSLNQIKIIPKMIEFCKRWQSMGYELFVITNQSGVARGYFDEEFVQETHKVLNKMLLEKNINVKAFYYCPHHPEFGTLGHYKKECECRKPNPGMLLSAAKEFNIDLKTSLMIGDSAHDVLAGKRAGCKSFLVKNIIENESFGGFDQ
ncbi:HAD family hydrolase [Candidatus Babeliales bacterium]|nr:HAD family hydrolase [Candidatus Babeliales bacterium]